jgi:hypothetical protein
MKSMDIQSTRQDDRSTGSYIFTIRMALVFLLLGEGCLGLAKFFPWPKASGDHQIIAHLTEALGWGLLVLTGGALFRKLMYGKYVKENFVEIEDLKVEKFTDATHSSPFALAYFSSVRSSKIDDLYAELRPLMSRAVADSNLKDEVQRKLSVLRRLQTEEANEMENRFEDGLLLKPGEGWQALERAREILARYENPPPPKSPAPRKS